MKTPHSAVLSTSWCCVWILIVLIWCFRLSLFLLSFLYPLTPQSDASSKLHGSDLSSAFLSLQARKNHLRRRLASAIYLFPYPWLPFTAPLIMSYISTDRYSTENQCTICLKVFTIESRVVDSLFSVDTPGTLVLLITEKFVGLWWWRGRKSVWISFRFGFGSITSCLIDHPDHRPEI